MSKCLLLLLLVITANPSKAQNSTRIYIKTQPLLLIEPYNGSLATLGTEFTVKNFGFYTEGGLYTSLKIAGNSNQKGFMFKEEIKWYVSKEEKTSSFISIEGCYSEMSCMRTNRISVNDSTYEKKYGLTRKFPGLVLQFGAIWQYGKSFFLEFAMGLGLRYNQVSCTLSDEEADHRELGDWTVPNTWIYRNGNHLIHKVNLGLKLGWRIR